MVPTCWRMCAPRSPSTAAHTPSKLGNANAMLGIADTGMRFASGEPTVKKSSAPERTWLSMSVEPPSALVGKIWMSTRPLVAARIASQASVARLLIGCVAGRSLPYFRLNSAGLRARADGSQCRHSRARPRQPRTVRLEIFPMTFPPRSVRCFSLGPNVSSPASLRQASRRSSSVGRLVLRAWDGGHDRRIGDARDLQLRARGPSGRRPHRGSSRAPIRHVPLTWNVPATLSRTCSARQLVVGDQLDPAARAPPVSMRKPKSLMAGLRSSSRATTDGFPGIGASFSG